jgi:hypothetical protein
LITAVEDQQGWDNQGSAMDEQWLRPHAGLAHGSVVLLLGFKVKKPK